jgi:hypothetical protein
LFEIVMNSGSFFAALDKEGVSRTARFHNEKTLSGAGGFEPPTTFPQSKSAKQDATPTALELAQSLARETQIDPDLARLIDVWPTIPPTVKRMILAAIDTPSPDGLPDG